MSTNMFWPDVINETGPKTHFALTIAQNAIQDHERALVSLKEQIDALQSGSSSSGGSSSGGSSGGGTVTPVTPTTPTLGTVTIVTATSYFTQTSDYGGIVVFNSATAVAVTVNYAVAMNWFATYENIGAGLVTFTPNSGTINGAASLNLVTGTGCVIYFDGMNFYAFTVPTGLLLETNGAPNGSQSLLNLVEGTNVTLTDDGAGNVTINATGGSGTADRGPLQSNANGWWWVWTDGVIEQFGSITIAATMNEQAAGLITYPTAFATQVFAFEAYVVGLPKPASTRTATVQSSTVGLTTSGINLQCNVPTGGGGATFDQAVVVQWRAIGI
jgi:hypothetical protein